MNTATLRCTAGRIAGRELALEAELMIGREFGEPGRLGGDPRLSRQHARIYRNESGELVVEDLGSANGTWVNGERLSAARTLQPGDVLKLGHTEFEVAAPQPAVAPEPHPSLRVLDGPLAGREIPVAGELRIGRSYDGDGSLGGSQQISRRHARIAVAADGTTFVEDTGSTNGTFVNGKRIRGPRALRDGDEIRIGEVTLAVAGTAPIPPPALPQPSLAARGPAPSPAAPAFAPRGAAGARRHSRTIVAGFAGFLAVVVAVSTAAVLIAAPKGPKTCALDRPCQPPATSPPLNNLTTYRGALGQTVEYTKNNWKVERSDGSNLKLTRSTTAGDISLWIQGEPAAKAPRDVAEKRLSDLSGLVIGMADDTAPEHRLFLPTVGFRSGVGGSFAGTVNSPQGAGTPITVAVMASTDSRATLVISVQIPNADAQFHDEAANLADQVIKTIRFPRDGGS